MNRAWILGILALGACVSTAPAGTSPDGLTSDDQVQMYSQIIQRLLGPDDTYGDSISAGKIYVDTKLIAPSPPGVVNKVIDTEDSDDAFFAPWPKDIKPEPKRISETMRTKLEQNPRLAQYQFQWVPDPKELKRDPRTGALPDGRPTLVLTQLLPLSPGRVYATGMIFVASEVSGMCLYIFKKDDSGWHFERRIEGPVS